MAEHRDDHAFTVPRRPGAVLKRQLQRVGEWVESRTAHTPWGSMLGLGRTVLAMGTLGTLLLTPTRILLSPLAGGVQPPVCTGIEQASLWCLTGDGNAELARWISIAILLVVASGWRPRFTGILHWWVCWSFIAVVSVQDGGDQITADLALLLIPITLADPRVWHWNPGPARVSASSWRNLISYGALFLIQVQVAVLYFQAAFAKISVPQWADGTAIYYWFHDPVFGLPPYLSFVTDAVSANGTVLTIVTWGSIALEALIAFAIFLPRPTRLMILPFALLFHDLIALFMGLASFDFAMNAALILYLTPPGANFPTPRNWGRALLHARFHNGFTA